MLRFCTSISWRVLLHYREQKELDGWDADSLKLVDKAEKAWRNFLLKRSPHVRPFRQHLLPLEGIVESSFKVASNINRYLLRTVDIDILKGSHSIYTFAKLGPIVITGWIMESDRPQNRWSGTSVNVNAGTLKPRRVGLPDTFGDYLNQKAHLVAQKFASMSDAQVSKISADVERNSSRFFESMTYDALLFDSDLSAQHEKVRKD